MKYFIKKSAGFTALDVEANDAAITVVKGGREYLVTVAELAENQYSVIVDDHPHIVSVSSAKNTIHIEMKHQRYSVPVLNNRQKMEVEMFGAAEDEAGSGDITAPMPGLILRVEVTAGESITAGQPLLVMEAMKMENEIRAPEDGVVAEVLVKAQQAVEKDDIMIKIGSE